MLPITTSLEISRILINIAFVSLNNEKKLREKQIEADAEHKQMHINAMIEKNRMELEINLEKQRLKLEKHKIKAQKEIILRLIDLSQYAFDRKMDFFIQTFMDFSHLIAQQQDMLAADLRTFREKEFNFNLSIEEQLNLSRRVTEIKNDLVDLRKHHQLALMDFNQKVEALSFELATDTKLMLQKL